MRSRLLVPAVIAALGAAGGCSKHTPSREELGKQVFFDQAMSHPAGQACADCHAPHVAYRDPESDHTTSAGVLVYRFGSRNAPSIMYARFVPDLAKDVKGEWRGGLFWDGRGGSLEKQAGFPLLNPAEMNNPDKATVVEAVRHADYADAFKRRYGKDALDDNETAFAHIADAIAAFERTPELAPFSSKYDRYLRGEVQLSASEQRGLAIFEGKAGCASCHPSRAAEDGTPPLFTNFGYANLGIPRYDNSRYFEQAKDINPAGEKYVDLGLGAIVHEDAQNGKFRTPTLRNIARSGPYGHNGYFENLRYMLDFLNTRDTGSHEPGVKPWAAPEVAANVDQHVGHLGLTDAEVEDLATFLETLTDVLEKAPPPIKNPRAVNQRAKTAQE